MNTIDDVKKLRIALTKLLVMHNKMMSCIEAFMDECDPPVESRNEVERVTRGPI